jgi:hypothetical protein
MTGGSAGPRCGGLRGWLLLICIAITMVLVFAGAALAGAPCPPQAPLPAYMAWTYETGLPQFKSIGPTGTTMDFTARSSAGEDPSVVLADGSIVSDRNGSGGWRAALVLRDNTGAQLQATSMNSTTNGSASLPTVMPANGQTYGFFGVNHADYKASGIGNYTLHMTSRCDFNHIDIVVP